MISMAANSWCQHYVLYSVIVITVLYHQKQQLPQFHQNKRPQSEKNHYWCQAVKEIINYVQCIDVN